MLVAGAKENQHKAEYSHGPREGGEILDRVAGKGLPKRRHSSKAQKVLIN